MTNAIKNCRCMPECVCKPASNAPQNPLAFACAAGTPDNGDWQSGLPTRAYLAAHAPITVKDALDYLRANETRDVTLAFYDYTTVFRTLAQMRLAYADAMLEAGVI